MGPSESADSSRNFARFAAFVALVVGCFVLAGWQLDMETLTNLVPGWPRMVRLTALCFILSGASLWLIDPRRRAILDGVRRAGRGLRHVHV